MTAPAAETALPKTLGIASPPIYLDYNATTPVAPEVVAAMQPFLTSDFGNPSSQHVYGVPAAQALETARGQVATLLGCAADEVVFTSCATESDNLAVKGVALAAWERTGKRPGHLITSAVEHPAVLAACRYLESTFGFALTVLPVDGACRVNPDDVRRAIRPDTALISVMHAQNETGVLQPVAEIGRIAREHGVLFHVDAAQSVGKVPVDVAALGCDLLSVAGHKLYAPKGVGALYVRSGVTLHPLLHGAGYEGGRRGGTANVPYAVGLGAACELAGTWLASDGPARQRALRDRLHHVLDDALYLHLNGHRTERLPNTLNVSLVSVIGEPVFTGDEVLVAAPGIAASTGAACHAGETEPSATLLAMGLHREVALGALRLSLGRETTEEAVDAAAAEIVAGAAVVKAARHQPGRHTRYQGAIVKDGAVLLIQHVEHLRSRSYWLLPGGGMEDGETPEECVAREMLEETGLTVRVERLVMDVLAAGRFYTRQHTYLCSVISGEAAPGYEPEADASELYGITGVRWVALADSDAWEEDVKADPLTLANLYRLRRVLGYAD